MRGCLSRERGHACRSPCSILGGRRRRRQENPHARATQGLDNSLGYTVPPEGHSVNTRKQWPRHLSGRVGVTDRRRRRPTGACRLRRCGSHPRSRSGGQLAGSTQPLRRVGAAPCGRAGATARCGAPTLPTLFARTAACVSAAPAVAAAAAAAAVGAAPRARPALCLLFRLPAVEAFAGWWRRRGRRAAA